MLSREQYEAVEKVARGVPSQMGSGGLGQVGWELAVDFILNAIRAKLVMKVEVSPTATATGTLEGLDGLGRRGQG
jgi:hypothetical protein